MFKETNCLNYIIINSVIWIKTGNDKDSLSAHRRPTRAITKLSEPTARAEVAAGAAVGQTSEDLKKSRISSSRTAGLHTPLSSRCIKNTHSWRKNTTSSRLPADTQPAGEESGCEGCGQSKETGRA